METRGYGFNQIQQRIIQMHADGLSPRAISRTLKIKRQATKTTLLMYELALQQGEVEIKFEGDELQILKRETKT